jgi:hypothetical protein
MPPRETLHEEYFQFQPPIQNVDYLKATPPEAVDYRQNEALNMIVEGMSPDRKKHFQEFIDGYVGDSDPENRKGVHKELPNTIFETPWGETFNYCLPCIAVLDLKTGKVIVVSKDDEKDNKRAKCWRVVQYDIFANDPELAILEYNVQNVIINPLDGSDSIILDIVGANSPRYADYQLYFSLSKKDYSRDESQPVTLSTVVPYGEKPEVNEYPVDVGKLCDKINIDKPANSQKLPQVIQQELGHIATVKAA